MVPSREGWSATAESGRDIFARLYTATNVVPLSVSLMMLACCNGEGQRQSQRGATQNYRVKVTDITNQRSFEKSHWDGDVSPT
jgi:ABC-type microcin C transport system permease subunit YejE